ncbi:discoidin domain-containing protein [Corallococcus llansteffanensis]|uniref:F5/8 type C domain-containing protein n=1 Tax=Corallococcus llansteffanensis TaxID=2316731 RepID=A0A3A8PK99_9BACT|nr:discoidin domain-containing protein [Corallococcus llansteffanensis]RKH52952.1 hypothetical protein D7V93_27330 [Corallococcus llansteffanensis]
MKVFSRLGLGLGLMGLMACGAPSDPQETDSRQSEAAVALPTSRLCSSVPCLPNLARAATVTVSSTTGSSPTQPDTRWAIDKALDGNRESVDGAFGWSSMSSGAESTSQWIRFDFGTQRSVNEVQLYARNDATFGTVLGDGFPRDFVIEVSADGATWTPVVTQVNQPTPTEQLQSFRFSTVQTRFLRIRATRLDSVSGSYYFQLAEVELYDNPGQLTYTFSDGEQAEITLDNGDASVSEDILVGEATELDGLFVEYQAYINQVGSAQVGSTDGVSASSAGINTHQRCKFWQVGCWKRKIIDSRWPNNTVYYEFHREVSDANRQAIRGFITDWNSRAPVQWVEDTSRFSRVMFKVKNLSNACGNSIVGRSGLPQKIRIDPDCVTQRTVQHEMGHAVGLIHEQQRCDRDTYVTGIGNDSNNRKECAAKYTTFGPYDYSSVMHYRSGTAVSPQPLGSVGTSGSPGGLLLGCYDRLGIHKLYGVAGGPGPTTTDAAVCNLSRNAAVTVSSTTGYSATQPDTRWTSNRAVDGLRDSNSTSYGWSSMGASSAATTQWIRFEFPFERRVSRVDLYPRNDATYGTVVGDGFPVNFSIEVSTDGANWTSVVTRTNHPRPGGVQTYEFTARPARFVRVVATNLRAVGGMYYVQLAELEVF